VQTYKFSWSTSLPGSSWNPSNILMFSIHSITGINQYYIKSTSATMGMRRQASSNDCITGFLFYSTAIVAWLCVPLLLKSAIYWIIIARMVLESCHFSISKWRDSMWWHLQDYVALLQPQYHTTQGASHKFTKLQFCKWWILIYSTLSRMILVRLMKTYWP
jgi:hypothetical protein